MRTVIGRRVSIALAILAAVGCSDTLGSGLAESTGSKATTPNSSDGGGDWSDRDKLDAFVRQQMTAGHIVGLEAVIVKRGGVVFQSGYDYATLDPKTPVTSNTVFRLASVSKTFTATLLMKLYEDGKKTGKNAFALDDDIDTVLGFSVRSPGFADKPITYRQLLTHLASINDNYDLPAEDEALLFPANGDSKVSLEEFCTRYFTKTGKYYDPVANFWAGASPGTQFHYSNMAITLAGYLVQKLAGRSFEDYARTALFEPLGMTETSWRTEGFAPTGGMATPYSWSADGGAEAHGQYGYPTFPAGTLRTSGSQLARFLIMLTNHGEIDGTRILDGETLDEMEKVQLDDGVHRQGLVFYYDDAPGTAYPRIGHNGSDPGVGAEMYWRQGDPDRLGALVLVNSDMGPEVYAVLNALFDYGAKL